MKRRHLAAGLLASAAALAAVTLYRRRPIERVTGVEGLDDPAVARGYAWVTRMPQMALMRRVVASRAAALQPEGHAADIGCGPGLLVLDLLRAAPGLSVTGVDLSPEMIAMGEENAAAAGLASRADFRLGDAARLPFDDASLDLVVSTMSLHHWSDPVAVFSDVARVLRPGGAFLIVDLKRDLALPAWLLLWFATNVVVPRALRFVGEPLGSRNSSYTPDEAALLARRSRLTGWHVTEGPLWLMLEGRKS